MKVVITLMFMITCFAAQASGESTALIAGEQSGPVVRELNWLNSSFLAKQRNRISEMVGIHFGRKIQGNRNDIALLQRIIDEELIPRDNKEELQAMGVILGDLFTKEHKLLQWRVYEDELGPTQAVCVGESVNCLFPITMLSRRIEVGLKPSVLRVYEDALEDMKQFLPHTPYSVTQ